MRLRGIEFRKFNVYRLNNLSETEDLLKPAFDRRDLIFRNVNKDNLKDIISTRENRYYYWFKRYLEEGEQGYYVYIRDKVIACGWVFFNLSGNKIKKKYMIIPRNFVWLHDFWTHPDFRGYGIYPTLLKHICKDILFHRRVPHPHNILIDTDCSNFPSNRGIIKANFEFIGNITALRFLKNWIILRSTYGKKVLY